MRRAAADRASSRRARRDGAVALAAVRGDGGVAAPARRRAGRRRAQRVRRRSRTCRASAPRARRWRGLRRGAAARARRSSAASRAHRRAVRESQAHVDALRAELEALGLPVTQLNGEQVFALLWARLNPTSADGGRRPPARRGRGARRARRRRATASRRARPRWRCASRSPRSSLDLKRDAPPASRSSATSSRSIYAHTHRAADDDGLAAWARC